MQPQAKDRQNGGRKDSILKDVGKVYRRGQCIQPPVSGLRPPIASRFGFSTFSTPSQEPLSLFPFANPPPPPSLNQPWHAARFRTSTYPPRHPRQPTQEGSDSEHLLSSWFKYANLQSTRIDTQNQGHGIDANSPARLQGGESLSVSRKAWLDQKRTDGRLDDLRAVCMCFVNRGRRRGGDLHPSHRRAVTFQLPRSMKTRTRLLATVGMG